MNWIKVTAPNAHIATCRCGKSHTLRDWVNLPYVGRQLLPDDGEPPWAEYRNCSCGSTLIVFLDSDLNFVVAES
jgi:hypothetical protein